MISLFFGLKIFTNVKNKYEKGIIYHFLIFENSLNFKKMKIMLQHFPIGFGLATIKKKFR